MKIVVVGPGALGCLLAAYLTRKGGHAIWLLDHNAQRAKELARIGLLLEGEEDPVHCPVQATAEPREIGPAELILLCVKAHAVREFLASDHAALFTEESLLIAFQNGIAHLAPLQTQEGPARYALGVTAHGATLLGPGRVCHAGKGPTSVGFIKEEDLEGRACLAAAAQLLSAAGIETKIAPAILSAVWMKLMVNVGINALTALLNCPNGGILELPAARVRLIAAVQEAAAVARAKGIVLEEDPVARALAVCQATARNISSMLQDVRNSRLTEIDAINGAIVQEGRLLSLATPVNEQLVADIKALEARYLIL